MVDKIKVGDKVRYNNLVFTVVSVEPAGSKEYLEIQPGGSSTTISVDSSQVTKIMSEGIRDKVEVPLYS